MPFVCEPLKSVPDSLQRLQHRGKLGRVVDLPVLLRRQAHARPVGAAALVGAAERGGRGPRRRNQLRGGQARGEDSPLQVGDVGLADQTRDRRPGTGSCQSNASIRNQRAAVAAARAQVAMQQLEPRPGKGVFKLRRIRRESASRFPRIADSIRIERSVVSIIGACFFDGSCASITVAAAAAFFRLVLRLAGRTRGQFPVVVVEVLQEVVVPFDRVVGPGALEPAGNGVVGLTAAVGAGPAQALLLDVRALRIWADVRVGARRRAPCRRCGRRRSARPSPRRSWPCA